ncbi:hypothetical protein ACH5RR_021812 [Cinchona calisaya]|uniref:Uncharacterized protein n=1 Tax=Cinchona calisaya TaxID=153742 RepID=A0ABD2ZIN7_9GENT
MDIKVPARVIEANAVQIPIVDTKQDFGPFQSDLSSPARGMGYGSRRDKKEQGEVFRTKTKEDVDTIVIEAIPKVDSPPRKHDGLKAFLDNLEPVGFEKATKRLGDAKAWFPCVLLTIKFEFFNLVGVKSITFPLVIGEFLDQEDVRSISSKSSDMEGEEWTLVTRRIFRSSPKPNKSLTRRKMV